MEIIIDGVFVMIDEAQTAAFYARAPELDCPCRDCLNFLQALPRLPSKARDFMASIGVPLSKSTEVYSLERDEAGCLRYGGFTSVCGKLPEHVERTASWAFAEGCSVYFTRDRWLRHGDFPEPAMQMEFTLTLPWMLDTPRESS